MHFSNTINKEGRVVTVVKQFFKSNKRTAVLLLALFIIAIFATGTYIVIVHGFKLSVVEPRSESTYGNGSSTKMNYDGESEYDITEHEDELPEKERTMETPEIYVGVYNETLGVKPGDEIVYSGRTNAAIKFRGYINEDELRENVIFEPVFEPSQIHISHPEKGGTFLYFNLIDNEKNRIPDSYKIKIPKGIRDNSGSVLGQDIVLGFIRKQHPLSEISLIDETSGKKLPYNVYLSNEDKVFLVEFTKDMNREAVEETISENVCNESLQPVLSGEPKPRLTFEWENPRLLYINISGLEPGRHYRVFLKGVEDTEGCRILDSRYYTSEDENRNRVFDEYSFETGLAQEIWSMDLQTGRRTTLKPFTQNRYHSGSLSPDGKWVSMGRFSQLEGDLYFHDTVFFNLFSGQLLEMGTVRSYKDIRWVNGLNCVTANGYLYNLEEGNIKNLAVDNLIDGFIAGALPSCDGSRAAVFLWVDRKNAPSKLVILDKEGNTEKIMDMPFTHIRLADGIYVKPMYFEWLDNDTIISEGWDLNNTQPGIYRIKVSEGRADKIIENAYHPDISPDRTHIAVMRTHLDGPDKGLEYIEFTDLEGRPVRVEQENGFEAEVYPVYESMWSPDSDKFMIFNTSGSFYGSSDRFILIWNRASGKAERIDVDNNESFTVLGITEDGKNIICTNQQPLPRF